MSERLLATFVDAPKGARGVERPDQLKALARRCRELAAATADEQTAKSLELLAQDYDARVAENQAELPPQQMPKSE
jgi:CHASE3 domain sensor protein